MTETTAQPEPRTETGSGPGAETGTGAGTGTRAGTGTERGTGTGAETVVEHAEHAKHAEHVEQLEQLERYVRFWNAGTEPEQRRLAAEVFNDGFEYRAEVGVLSGARALMDFRNQFVAHMGTAVLRLREQPRVHHHRARLRWEILTGDDRTSFAAGTDTVQFDDDGRISAVTAFLDRAPEGFDPGAHH